MQTASAIGLLKFLRRESTVRGAATAQRYSEATAVLDAPALRVPLELDGALWSAVVERVADGAIDLIVDREAVGPLQEQLDGAIHFQPDNDDMQRACGRVTASDALAGHRVRLNFELI